MRAWTIGVEGRSQATPPSFWTRAPGSRCDGLRERVGSRRSGEAQPRHRRSRGARSDAGPRAARHPSLRHRQRRGGHRRPEIPARCRRSDQHGRRRGSPLSTPLARIERPAQGLLCARGPDPLRRQAAGSRESSGASLTRRSPRSTRGSPCFSGSGSKVGSSPSPPRGEGRGEGDVRIRSACRPSPCDRST